MIDQSCIVVIDRDGNFRFPVINLMGPNVICDHVFTYDMVIRWMTIDELFNQ